MANFFFGAALELKDTWSAIWDVVGMGCGALSPPNVRPPPGAWGGTAAVAWVSGALPSSGCGSLLASSRDV